MARTKIGLSILNTNIVQVVTNTPAQTSSSTYTSTNLTASITPSSASSRIKIIVTGAMQVTGTNNAFLSVFRGSTDLAGNNFGFSSCVGSSGTNRFPTAIIYIDSPATTSATTYTVKIRSGDNTGLVSIPTNGNTEEAVMVLEEIN